jgi:hypothetical protein
MRAAGAVVSNVASGVRVSCLNSTQDGLIDGVSAFLKKSLFILQIGL